MYINIYEGPGDAKRSTCIAVPLPPPPTLAEIFQGVRPLYHAAVLGSHCIVRVSIILVTSVSYINREYYTCGSS